MYEILLLILIVVFLFIALMAVGLFKKRKFNGHLKIFDFFEGHFESED